MSLIYRGTSSDDVHFNVTERRVYNAPAFDVTGIEVPGRSGDILNSQERFKNKSIVYTGFIRSSDFPGDTTRERLSRGLRTIKAWVCGDAGKYHDLTDDYDPGFVRRAFVSGETAISEVLDRPDGATITITFMAEPFMYEESDPIELPETGTASGAIASFEGVAAPLQSLKFSIEPKQSGSGDPSPSNIRPISGWSQVDAVAAGVNLLDPAIISQGSYENPSATANVHTDFVSVKPNTAYTISLTTQEQMGEIYVRKYKADKTTYTSSQIYNNYKLTVTTDADTAFALISFYRSSGLTVQQILDAKPQLELGSTASPYAAPTITPITIALGQTVYGGTVDALAGEGESRLASKTYSGAESENWSYSGGRFLTLLSDAPDDSTSRMEVLCNIGKYASTGSAVRTIFLYGKYLYYYAPSNITTVADFKTWLASNNLQVVYPLASPTALSLTPVSVSSLLGQNNVWASCGDTEVVYVEPTENPTEWPSKPRLEITMSGAGTLTVNGKTWSIGAYTGTLICDSEIMDWYDASNLKNSLVSGDGFPELQPGENVITYTGGITKVVAKPRWRTL